MNQVEIAINDNYNDKLLVNTAKAIWRTLRDQFVWEHRKVPVLHSGMEAPDEYPIYAGGWHFYHMLCFLKETVTPGNRVEI
jgi:hypothetical protein